MAVPGCPYTVKSEAPKSQVRKAAVGPARSPRKLCLNPVFSAESSPCLGSSIHNLVHFITKYTLFSLLRGGRGPGAQGGGGEETRWWGDRLALLGLGPSWCSRHKSRVLGSPSGPGGRDSWPCTRLPPALLSRVPSSPPSCISRRPRSFWLLGRAGSLRGNWSALRCLPPTPTPQNRLHFSSQPSIF